MLKYVLQIKNDDMLKQSNITSKIHPYIDKTKKPRLIEAPQAELKIVQRRIKTLLGKIQTPDNVFSGIKGNLIQKTHVCILEEENETSTKLI